MAGFNLITLLRRRLVSITITSLVAFQLLNASVDPHDREFFGAKEDISHNDFETLLELLAEDLLNFTGCIPEADETDTDASHHVFSVISVVPPVFEYSYEDCYLSSIEYRHLNTARLLRGISQQFLPPPEFS